MNCGSVFSQGNCLHGCMLDEGHSEKHECECNIEWDSDESEEL